MTTAAPETTLPVEDPSQETPTHTSHDKEKGSVAEFDPAPDGGLEAWLVAVGAATASFVALGYVNSYGVLQEYYMRHQLPNESPDSIAWIGSLASFLQLSSGLIAGAMFDRFGGWVIRPAALLYVFSVMMTSLCTKYWQFMLAQGVLGGTANGFVMFPAMAAVSQYFDKKRATALGVAISGSSIGGVILPIAISKMLNGTSLGFGWTIRIVGFIMLPLLAFACVTIKSRLPPRQTNWFIGAAWKDVNFVLLVVALFFLFMGFFTPFFFLPTYAVSRGMDATLASYLLAILNAASTFGRIIPGILADKFGRLNVFSLGGLTTGVIVFCFNSVESNAALIVYAIAFGFTSGTIISGVSTAFTTVVKDPRDMGTYLGMGMGTAALAALVGPPVNGVLVDKYGGFSQVSIFSGTVCLVGGFVAVACKAARPEGILGRV